MTATDEVLALHQRLDGVTSGLGCLELRALIAIAERIRMGQERYGELRIGDPRDFVREMTEEALDFIVYSAFRDVLATPPKSGEGGK